MVGSLDLVRLPLGIAQREALRVRRPDVSREATFSRLLLPIRLKSMPLPVPPLTTVMFLGIWPDFLALERFRSSSLSRWRAAEQHVEIDLKPVQGFGSWLGRDPLDGYRSDARPGPVLLITRSRTRPGSMVRFMVTDGPVVRAVDREDGQLWAGGFMDSIATLDTGTLSLWRDTSDAMRFAYGPGVHQDAVKAQRVGGWFSESWFGRLALTRASGNWAGLDVPPLNPL